MIHLGLDAAGKMRAIREYCERHPVTKVIIFSPEKFALPYPGAEVVEYRSIIMYAYFYRLLQEIDTSTLLVINECLRTQNRYDLTYNCLRNYLNQTDHQLVFQYLPIIDTVQDFFILFDFDTRSRFKRESKAEILSEAEIMVSRVDLRFRKQSVPTPPEAHERYGREKERLFANLGTSDPHTIPRRLLLTAGKLKLQCVGHDSRLVGRNNRFKVSGMQTYRDTEFPHRDYVVFELPHNFIDFSDFMSLSGQTDFAVMATDLRVDEWYFERYREWAERINEAYATIHQQQNRS